MIELHGAAPRVGARVARANDLVEGEHRLGWLADGLNETPQVSCNLIRRDGQIELHLPWISYDSPFRRWFGSEGTHYGDDPDRSRFRYSPPQTLWFHDLRGCVTLLGCRDVGSNNSGGLGQGRIAVSRAVFGGRHGVDYHDGLHGLRTVVPGFSTWLALRSLDYRHDFNEGGRLERLNIELKSPPPLKISRAMNLTFRPSFEYEISAHGDTSEIKERILIETKTKTRRGWTDHWSLHHYVRELVGLSAWRPFNLDHVHAHRSDDPERLLSGQAVGDRWAPVLQSNAVRYPAAEKPPQFLFTFDEVGGGGVRRWIALRHEFKRGVLPVLDTLGHRDSAVETQVSQCGIGLDGIGYQLALNSGLSLRAANDEQHKLRLARIVDDLPITMPFDTASWIEEGSRAYNAVKHANRESPSFEDLVNVRRLHQLVFRVWVAGRLGTPKKLLRQTVERDAMAQRPTIWKD